MNNKTTNILGLVLWMILASSLGLFLDHQLNTYVFSSRMKFILETGFYTSFIGVALSFVTIFFMLLEPSKEKKNKAQTSTIEELKERKWQHYIPATIEQVGKKVEECLHRLDKMQEDMSDLKGMKSLYGNIEMYKEQNRYPKNIEDVNVITGSDPTKVNVLPNYLDSEAASNLNTPSLSDPKDHNTSDQRVPFPGFTNIQENKNSIINLKEDLQLVEGDINVIKTIMSQLETTVQETNQRVDDQLDLEKRVIKLEHNALIDS